MTNKINSRKQLFQTIANVSKDQEDTNFADDLNNAEDVSSFVDDYVRKLVDQHMDSAIDNSLDELLGM